MLKYLLTFAFLFTLLTSYCNGGGGGNAEKFNLNIRESTGKITLDGILDEPAWEEAQVATSFQESKPYDTAQARSQTEVRMTYDEHFLYVGAVCYNSSGKKNIVQSLNRDFSINTNDAFQVIFDPFGDNTNGFSFGVHAFGSQREGVITNGGNWGVTTNWNNKWYSKVVNEPDKWTLEIAIPFSSIRFTDGASEWKINFTRTDIKINEMSTWAPVPRNFNVSTLTYTGTLKWDKPVRKTGTNVSLIPYISGKFVGDYTDSVPQTKTSANFGFDAKIAVTSSLNLDLTYNPDFSQVDADQQVANISRFSIYYPEKRQFFLENADLFGQLGFSKIRPFFSRKIGLERNPKTGIYEQIPIISGIRLSGKVNNNLRVGLLNVTTPYNERLSAAPKNYTVGVLQRQIGSNSNITFSFVNKQLLGDDSTKRYYFNPDGFQRIAGLDYNFATKSNKIKGFAFIHQQFSPNPKGNEGANGSFLSYSTKNWFLMWNHEYVGKNYNPQVGFVPRNDHWRLEPEARYTWYPKKEGLISRSVDLYENMYMNAKLQYVKDLYTTFTYSQKYKNTSNYSLFVQENYTRLTFDFDPAGVYDTVLLNGSDYVYYNAGGSYTSDGRKKLFYNVNSDYGSYYNGKRLNFSASATFRAQPWGRFSLNFTQQNVYMPKPYQSANYTVFGPRFDFSFTKTFFWTNYFQYNQQAKNLNYYMRIQWRFKPMSDLFIVYTDNYLADSNFKNFNDIYFQVQQKKNRALIVKLVYWFNV